jgi:hypothetical protein
MSIQVGRFQAVRWAATTMAAVALVLLAAAALPRHRAD